MPILSAISAGDYLAAGTTVAVAVLSTVVIYTGRKAKNTADAIEAAREDSENDIGILRTDLAGVRTDVSEIRSDVAQVKGYLSAVSGDHFVKRREPTFGGAPPKRKNKTGKKSPGR